jgi:molybdopterin-guanine dinucleotide biosynthesis protein B
MAFFGPPAGGLRALVRVLPPVDLVVAEGFRSEPVPRIEIHRDGVSAEWLCADDRRVFAVVSDDLPPRRLPRFDPDADVGPLAELLLARLGLAPRRRASGGRVPPSRSRRAGRRSGRP